MVAPATPPPESPGSGHTGSGVIAGAVTGAIMFLGLLFATAVLMVRRRRNKEMEEDDMGSEGDEDVEPFMKIEMGMGPRRFTYPEFVDATRNFAVEEKLGQGAMLAVAIKRFSKESSMRGKKEHVSEIKLLSRLHHRNLVQLIGWCHHGRELLLEREQCVVHRDIKPSNVMLDDSFNAKLGDFGLARLMDHTVGIQTMTSVSGTPGYMDPQCAITGRASAESDVYIFGVVLLEVACGKKPENGFFQLAEWVWKLYGQGAILEAVDAQLNGEYDALEDERVMVVGLWCARPSIRKAMETLQSKDGCPLPVLPGKMPVPMYASLQDDDGLSLSTTSSSMTAVTHTSSSSRR
ncbi:hypothetical protein BRADI_1g28315v3 [Brachypodium distachyon]|uniref:Protein kinase domain-containing protein n=1 Tax=Brachypodium distachyon TaxID=15368 RepID=A0A0Q3NG28_BRADI|nr:hypothetical protein BRADI_1g28315v3 [Brachypodium distachyon]